MTDEQRKAGATRRDVMAGAAAAGVAAGVGPAVLGAGRAHAAEPKRGGTMRIGSGHGSTTDSTDATTFENGFTTLLTLGGINNNLTAIDENNQLEAELAEEWTPNADATEWTFKIRAGVEFHNGKTVTAQDAKAVLDHHRGPDSPSGAAGILAAITETRAEGDKLVVTVDGPNADFPVLVSDYHLPITPMRDDGTPDNTGIGAGGYVLREYEPGVRAIMTRNPNYWKSDRAWVDEAELITIADTAARQNALASGEVNVIDRVDPKTAHLLNQSPNVEVESTSSTLHYTLPMLATIPPFDDNNVRLALKHALDRDDVVDKILRGYGSAGNDTPITPANRFFNTELPPLPYDPDKAKFYLKQAGMDSLAVDLSTSDAAFAGAVDMAVVYKEHAAPAGIDINVIREAADGYWSDIWRVKPWSTCYWGGRPTEDWVFTTTYYSQAEWNDTNWENARFDELLIMGRAETNEDVRREIYWEMQQILRDEGSVVVAMFADHVQGRSTNVMHGPNIAGNWQLDGSRCIERWWLDDPMA